MSATSRPRVAIVYPAANGQTDGILAYSEQLTSALTEAGVTATLLTRTGADKAWSGSSKHYPRLPDLRADFDHILLQYNPFSYARWGFAPGLLRDLRDARRRGLWIGVVVHEAHFAATRVRQHPIALWQRVQLRGLLAQADVVFAATEELRGTVAAANPRVRVQHTPVGSNLPDRRAERGDRRERLGIGDDEFVLVAFGTGHPSQRADWVLEAARAITTRMGRSVLLNLGAGAPDVAAIDGLRTVTPGRLEAAELAECIAAGDLFVAPFTDGVSTRRTTFMAALQHGLPVLTTLGTCTDTILSSDDTPLVLVDADDRAAFFERAGGLACDPEARQAMAVRGRALYESKFAWPVIAKAFAIALDRR